jgi:hypothetical protein
MSRLAPPGTELALPGTAVLLASLTLSFAALEAGRERAARRALRRRGREELARAAPPQGRAARLGALLATGLAVARVAAALRLRTPVAAALSGALALLAARALRLGDELAATGPADRGGLSESDPVLSRFSDALLAATHSSSFRYLTDPRQGRRLRPIAKFVEEIPMAGVRKALEPLLELLLMHDRFHARLLALPLALRVTIVALLSSGSALLASSGLALSARAGRELRRRLSTHAGA